MKKFLLLPLILLAVLFGCNTQQKTIAASKNPAIKGDTVRIANDSLEYEIIIIDPGFNGWFAANAKPRNFYSQNYLEARNQIWVSEWNRRAMDQIRNRNLFEMQIDYQPSINYGYEVNYMLFNYLTYFQQVNNIRLGSFAPRN